MKAEGSMVKGLSKLLMQIQTMAAKADKDWNVLARVTFHAAYAIWVHERTDVFHANGQAKFLESALRDLHNSGELANLFTSSLQSGKSPAQAILICAMRLQREAQKRTPVDTGNLRNSANTVLEKRK